MFNGVLTGCKKAILLAILVLLFFCLMSRMDYVVNSTLYGYGLRFSYNWAWEYWITYNAIFVAFALAVSCVYWLGTNKTPRDMKFSIALLITILLFTVGGLQDVMFFVFWAGGLPPSNVVWWWAPWINLIGTWNSMIQVGFMTLTFGASICTWLLASKKTRAVPSGLAKGAATLKIAKCYNMEDAEHNTRTRKSTSQNPP